MKDKQTSFEPRPKPETTLPLIRNGNGSSGPESGPIIVGRGPSGRIVLSRFPKDSNTSVCRAEVGKTKVWWGVGGFE